MKSVLWRVAELLSYIEDARCLKVNTYIYNCVFDSITTNHKLQITLYVTLTAPYCTLLHCNVVRFALVLIVRGIYV